MATEANRCVGKPFSVIFHFEVKWLRKKVSVFMPQNLNLRSVTAVTVTRGISNPKQRVLQLFNMGIKG